MESMVMTAALLLSLALRASAGVFELPFVTSADGILDFWPKLNASCELKPLQGSLCCLHSTFKERSEAQNLLLKLLRSVPHNKHEVLGVSQSQYESRNGLEVGTRYMCDVPLGQEDEELPGLGCHRCLEAISQEISSGMSQNMDSCKNAWAVRFGYIYEPDSPWEEDTTWCHLDYWFRVLPRSHPSIRTVSTALGSEVLSLARSWLRSNFLPAFILW